METITRLGPEAFLPMWIYRCIVDTEVRTDASTPHGKSRLQSFRHRPHTPATMQKPEDSVISRGRHFILYPGMPSHSRKRQRRRGHPSGTLFPAENPDSVQSARPASSVETGIVSTYEAVAQADNNDGPQNADQSPVTHALQPSKNATRSQEVRCPPRSVFTASNSEVESQVCNAEAQDAQERDLSFDQEQPKRIQL
ncbi:hypothetical protein MPH_02567 [Macrophomina phaseolina MS6]|uniref:Uncharacterized protein n=1 Tax=Macrophomina phaseolina (strain MS6) TaxID=1126212 RepID=K2S559_MACPH|nr:hypothetical protein MPH_02567 [Macrophomina phaseolina MS6]